jgi:hypothetical protein
VKETDESKSDRRNAAAVPINPTLSCKPVILGRRDLSRVRMKASFGFGPLLLAAAAGLVVGLASRSGGSARPPSAIEVTMPAPENARLIDTEQTEVSKPEQSVPQPMPLAGPRFDVTRCGRLLDDGATASFGLVDSLFSARRYRVFPVRVSLPS